MSAETKWNVWYTHSIDNRVHFLKDYNTLAAEAVPREEAERVFLSLCDDTMLAAKETNAQGGWYTCVTIMDDRLVEDRIITMTPTDR